MVTQIRYVVPLLLVLSSFLGIPAAQAQQQKAVALLSVSSVDGLLGNISYLTRAAGQPDMGQMVTMMSAAYLEGIDRANPIGMVLTTDGQEFLPLGFVPVKDLSKVLASLEQSVGAPRDLGNGIKEIPGVQPVFVKEQNGWAFIGQTIESLATLPQNPAAALGQMPKEYDIAIRANVQNIPQQYLKMATTALQDGVKQGLQQLPEEDRAAQEEMIRAQMKQMETFITESDQITIGWKTEPAAQRTFIDINFTAVAGGSLAKQMSAMADAKSDFTGFVLPEAAASLSMSSEIPPEQIQSSIEAIEGLKKTALKEIEKDDDLESAEARSAAKEMLGAALDIFASTIKTGKMDGAASVVLESGNLSVLAGFHVASGNDVEAVLRRVAEMAKDEPKFPGINFNADSAEGVRFHTMNIAVPEEEDARKILGNEVTVAVGVGEDSAYFGFGRDCVAKLKSIIGSQAKQQPVRPFQLTVTLTPIMEFVASLEANPLIGTVTEAMKETGDKDHIRLEGIPIENGFTYRLEVEEGILRAIGEGAKMANGGGGF